MKRTQQLLERTAQELREARTLLTEKKRAVARATARHEKETAKLERKMIERTVRGIETHRKILKEEAAK